MVSPLSGEISVRELLGSSEAAWFEASYEAARVTPVTELQTPELSVLGFIGTWCGDTHVLLPAFVKLLDVSAVPRAKLQLIAVGRDKRGPQVERFQVTRLPTFILMHNGKELGRITESPETTLAGDLERILRRH